MTCAVSQLKNLRFKSISVMVLSIEHVSRVLIRWQLEPTAQNLANLRFFVDRGESPEDMKQLNGTGLSPYGLYEFVDYTANIFDLNKLYYYRVRAVEMISDTPVQTFTSIVTTWDGDLDLVGLYIVEEHEFAFRWVYGIPVMVFKKIHDGVYCPDCWDPILKRGTKANCTTCYGTGRFGGYYPPIEVWMSLDPDPKVEQVAEWGKRQSSASDTMCTNSPLLTPDDIIVELKSNRFWKVEYVRYPEKNRTIILQSFKLNAVNPSDIEYQITVPEDRRRVMVSQLEEREKEREF